MREQLLYYNNKGILKLSLNQYPYYAELSDLKDWVWGFNERFGNIGSFYRNKSTRVLSIGIAGDYLECRNNLCDVFTADIIAEKPGKLIMGDWELDCFITQAEHQYACELDRKIKFTVRATNATWIRKQTRSYNGVPDEGGGGGVDLGRDYSYSEGILGRGYNYGYSTTENHYASIDLPGIDNGYEVTIYGPQAEPIIYIDGYPIKVNVEIQSNERLVITSNGSTRKIRILTANGAERDAFVYRDKEYSPFITLGEHAELTYGSIRFDFTTIERRSEPTWN